MAYQWPGNVRELQNTVRNIVVLNDGQLVEFAMFPRQLQGLSPAPATRIAAHAYRAPILPHPRPHLG